GALEVMGTRFQVSQRAQDGEVNLAEGALRFVGADGQQVMLSAGQSLRWPLPAPSPAPAAPPRPAPVPAPTPPRPPPPPAARPLGPPPAPAAAAAPPAEAPEAIFERVAALRTRSRFSEAAAELERALRRPDLAPAARERLDFELGSVLSDHLHDRARACAHWRAHRHEFPAGRYDREIDRVERRLGCSNPAQESLP